MKKKILVMALLAAGFPALAFAGGPESQLPVKAQLRQEARAVHVLTYKVEHGASVAKMTPKVMRLDYALQNTAMQMHIEADFTRAANALLSDPDRSELLGNLNADARWLKIERL